jgi:PHD/YefM family antitoxin component YafN of YafNO toxin-antitoxin module
MTLSPSSARALAARVPLALDPRAPVAIKRNVHEVIVGAPADRLAAALRETLLEPGARFGPIVLKRQPSRAGAFVPGERFHGCFALPLRFPGAAWLEDRLLSDYAEVVSCDDRQVTYRYLSGTPIAGESRLSVEPHGPHARFEAVFTFQERGTAAILLLHLAAARLHDEVIRVQIERAAARLAAPILSSSL